MNVVARYPADDIRAMPKLLALTQLAVASEGCDFLGRLATELDLLDAKLGQFITPYEVARLMAELALMDAREIIAERGFITLQEPASGAGGMVLAAADVLQKQGFDPQSTLYVEATDVALLCFKMTYLQLAVRGVPATVIRGNSLSLESFESARTPAFLPFLRQHHEAFLGWRAHALVPEAAPPPTASIQGDLFDGPRPDPPVRHPRQRKKSDPNPT
jgi:hypothetical protein